MTELVTALLWVLVGILLGGLVVFAWVAESNGYEERFEVNYWYDRYRKLESKVHSKRDPKTGRYVK